MDFVNLKREWCGQKWKTQSRGPGCSQPRQRAKACTDGDSHARWQFGESDGISVQLLALLTASTAFMTWVQKKPPSPRTSAFSVVERTASTAPYQNPTHSGFTVIKYKRQIFCVVWQRTLSVHHRLTGLLTSLLKHICKRWEFSRLA